MQDISRQIGIALRWLPLVLIGALVAGAVAYALMSGQPKVYESTARLIVDRGPSPSVNDVAVAQDYAALYAKEAVSRDVANTVIAELGLNESARSLLNRISTTTSGDSLIMTIDVRDGDPESARLLALTIGDEMRQRVRERLVTDEVKDADTAIAANERAIKISQNRVNRLINKQGKTQEERDEIQDLFSQISALQADIERYRENSRAFVRNKLDWFERPTTPESPVAPRPLFYTLLALVVGGMLAAAIAFVIEYLLHANKVRDERDMEAATGVATLGSIREKRGDIRRGDTERLVMLRHPGSEAAEAYRGLLARIGFASGPARTLMVASVDSSDCKSPVAANLAIAYAEAGRNVVLVDADYRSPHVHSLFGVPNDRGVTNLLYDADVPVEWVTAPTPHPRLRLMPAGPPPPATSDPFGPAQIEGLVRMLLNVSDMVVFDSPSMAAGLDAAVLAAHLEGSVLVVPDGTSSDTAAEASRALHGAEAEVIGAVFYRQVRGSHRRSRWVPVVSGPHRRRSVDNTPPSPPRRIPATASGTGPPAPGRQAAPSQAGASGPGPGQGQPPAPVGGNPPETAPAPPPSRPYATPYRPDNAIPDS